MTSGPAPAARRAAQPRYLRLEGADLERYAQTASRLIWAARLNKWYPDPFAAADRLRFLAPSLNEGLYPAVFIDACSGLPRLKDILAVQVDREIAGDFLRQHQARLAAGRKSTPRVAAKTAYYQRLVRSTMAPIHSLDVKLRRVDAESSAASFIVVFDRFDMAEGLLTRYTLLLDQTDKVWGRSLLERSGDYTRQTSDFRHLMERLAQDESEILFLLLGKKEGIRVEEIVRGRIGPFWTPWTPPPKGFLRDFPSDGFVLHCPLDRTSVHLQQDMDSDPFGEIFRNALSTSSRSMIEDAAASLNYRAHKERKFACTPAAQAALEAAIRSAKTRSVVHTA